MEIQFNGYKEIADKTKELFQARADAIKAAEHVKTVQQELGALIGETLNFEVSPMAPMEKVAVSMPTVADGVDPHDRKLSLPVRFSTLFAQNPEKTYRPEEAAAAIGERLRPTHTTLLYRMAKTGKIFQAGPSLFQANRRFGKVQAKGSKK